MLCPKPSSIFFCFDNWFPKSLFCVHLKLSINYVFYLKRRLVFRCLVISLEKDKGKFKKKFDELNLKFSC